MNIGIIFFTAVANGLLQAMSKNIIKQYDIVNYMIVYTIHKQQSISKENYCHKDFSVFFIVQVYCHSPQSVY